MATFYQVNSSGQELWRNASATISWTPAATSHTALDSVGGAATITLPHAAGRMIRLTGYRFTMPTTTPVTTVWTAYLYNATPAVIADDAAYNVVVADQAKFLGTVTIAQVVDFGSTLLESQGALASNPYIQVPAGGVLTAYLQNVTTITTEAIAHTLTLFYEIQP